MDDIRRGREFIRRIDEHNPGIEAFILYKDGESVLEKHWGLDLPRNTYSHTKSYTGTLAGIAIAEGKMSLETSIAECFPQWIPQGLEELYANVTVRNILLMTSGFGGHYLIGRPARAEAGRRDLVEYMLSDFPLKRTPGERFCYSTADSIILGRMIEEKTCEPLDRFLKTRLFDPMGIPLRDWETCLGGHPLGGTGLEQTISEQIAIGILYLNGGKWNGTQLIPEEWARTAPKKHITISPSAIRPWCDGYGYHFWTSPYNGAFRAHGVHSQDTFVFPERNMIVGTQCHEHADDEAIFSLLHETLFQY